MTLGCSALPKLPHGRVESEALRTAATPRPCVTNPHPNRSVVDIIVGMARTVTVYDPATGSQFQATRTQWERLHEPRNRELVADETGTPVGQKAKTNPDPKPPTDTEE